MHITMVGTGYVGLVTGTCFAETGNDVICLDIDQSKVEMLNLGQSPIYEPGLSEMITRNAKSGRLKFTTDATEAYQTSEILFICVGTPPGENGQADLRYVLKAAEDIGKAIESDSGYNVDNPKIVVVKSTVPVGTNVAVQKAVASQTSKPFCMASNPEFLKEGAAITDFMKPDRVVVGTSDKPTGDRIRDLYDPFVRQGNPIFIMDIPSAEMVKYASNCMLATKISFINEMSNLCEHYGADIDEVRRGMCSDQRIGNQFLYPGLGYGGSCFPKDIQACIDMGRQVKHPAKVLESVHEVNQNQRDLFFDKITKYFGKDLPGKHLAVWGIAFKPGTDDIREAPAITLMRKLLVSGATVAAYDPVAIENAKKELGDQVKFSSDAMATLDGADALVICTNWGEFMHPDFEEMKVLMNKPVIFDGRNLYRLKQMKELGFTYHSIGRPVVD